jgi:hypothetical protein
MVAEIWSTAGGQFIMPGDDGCLDDRIRNWDEEWVSQLLEEALRLKEQFGERKPKPSARKARKGAHA